MFKIVFLFLSFFSVNFHEENYRLVYEARENIDYIKKIYNYYLYIENEIYYLKNSDKKIEIGEYEEVDFYMFDNEIIVITLDNGTLEYRRYEYNLKLKVQEEIIRDGALKISDYLIEDNKLFIVGKSGEDNLDVNEGFLKEDAFLIEINDKTWSSNYYGGIGNEEYVCIVRNKNYTYLLGKKDRITEGDFGNGGRYERNIFIAILNDKNELIDYKIIDRNKEIVDLKIYENKLFIILNDEVIAYDLLLNPLYFDMINHQVLDCKLTESGILALFSQKNATFIDFSCEKKEVIDYGKTFEKVVVDGDFLYLFDGENEYKGDILLLKDYLSMLNYERDEELFSIYGMCKLINNTFDPYLDYQVYGEYIVNLEYETIGGIRFNINTTYNIEKEVNIKDGGIYPVGYRLKFTGKGYLNGQFIINNYQIGNSGEYLLELIGANGEIESIKFTVDDRQKMFSENYNGIYDLEVMKNQDFNLKINLSLPTNHTVESVVVNGEVVSDVKYDEVNSLLYINMNGRNDGGIYSYNIEQLNLYSEELDYNKKVNMIIKVNVLDNNLSLELNDFNDLRMIIDSYDYDNTARYFEVVLSDGKEEKIKKYPICNSELILDLNEESLYDCEIYLVSDVGSSDVYRTLLVDCKVYGAGQINFGKILINRFINSLERFTIEFENENYLKEIVINNVLVYENLKKEKNEYIFYSVGIFLISLIVTIVIKEEKRKKRKNG